uniref:Uncharacterized protein n=1 Tax=Glossina palpalis gambiensis TaxID=67801 RepID=A0A1B0AXS2_9MUSC
MSDQFETANKSDTNLKNQSDGMHLIVESTYQLSTLKQHIQQSCLAEKCKFLEDCDKIDEICRRFLNLLKEEELNLDEITNIFVAACMCYYIQATTENIDWRSQFLQKAFQYVDTLSPLHLHVASKRLWEALKTDGIEFVFNLLSLSHRISIASETGRAIAICLIWAILCEITENTIEMYCFHEFHDLVKMLNEIDESMLQMEDNLRIVYILIQCIGFLINTIVFGDNESFKKAGYRNYFSYTKRDLDKLKHYLERLSSQLSIRVSQGDNHYDLRMTLIEYLKVNTTSVLEWKISKKQSK